jgi:hypothetical protein
MTTELSDFCFFCFMSKNDIGQNLGYDFSVNCRGINFLECYTCGKIRINESTEQKCECSWMNNFFTVCSNSDCISHKMEDKSKIEFCHHWINLEEYNREERGSLMRKFVRDYIQYNENHFHLKFIENFDKYIKQSDDKFSLIFMKSDDKYYFADEKYDEIPIDEEIHWKIVAKFLIDFYLNNKTKCYSDKNIYDCDSDIYTIDLPQRIYDKFNYELNPNPHNCRNPKCSVSQHSHLCTHNERITTCGCGCGCVYICYRVCDKCDWRQDYDCEKCSRIHMQRRHNRKYCGIDIESNIQHCVNCKL